MTRGRVGGVAWYTRSTLSLTLPAFAGTTLAPDAVEVFVAGPGREYLLVGVSARLGTGGTGYIPRLLVYDLSSVDPESCDDAPTCDPDMLVGVVATPARPAGPDAATMVWSIAVQRMPGSQTYSAAYGFKQRAVVLISTAYTVDAVDLSPLIGEDLLWPASSDPEVEDDLRAQFTGLTLTEPTTLPILTAVADTFTISAQGCDESESCGPPAFLQCDPDYPEIRSFGGRGLVAAGRWAAVGWASRGDKPGNALNVIAIAYETLDLSDLRLRLVGLASPDLTEAKQFETYGRFHFVESFSGAPWIVGPARASYGVVGFELPPQSQAVCAADYVEAAGFFPTDATIALPGNSCECEGGFVTAVNDLYPGDGAIIPVQEGTNCLVPADCLYPPMVPTGCADPAEQLPINLEPGLFVRGYSEGYSGLIELGFGQEFLGGTVIEGVGQDALLLADRSSNAVWAYHADPETAPILDVEGIIPTARAVVHLPSASHHAAPGGDRLVVAAGIHGSALTLLYWRWSPLLGGKHLERRLALVPKYGPGDGDRPVGYGSVVAMPPPDSTATVPTVVVAAFGRPRTRYFGAFDILVVEALGLGAQIEANKSQLETLVASLEASGQGVSLTYGQTGVTFADLPSAGVPSPRHSYFRFGRSCDADESLSTIIEWDDGSVVLEGETAVEALAQHDQWVYALVRSTGGADGPLADGGSEFWLVTFEMVSISSSVPLSPYESCELAAAAGGAEVDQGHLGDVGVWGLEVRGAIPLRSPVVAGTTEPPSLTVSPGGDFLCAMGEGYAGCWLVHVDSPAGGATPVLQVVAGLRKGGSGSWFGWDSEGETLSLGLAKPMNPADQDHRGQEFYPTWPHALDLENSTCPSPSRFGTNSETGEQGWPAEYSIGPPAMAAQFVEQDGELFLFLNTDPVTVWHIGEPAVAPWTYIGAVCAEDRLRVSLVAGDYLYLSGNRGTFAIPLMMSPPESGCCTGVE